MYAHNFRNWAGRPSDVVSIRNMSKAAASQQVHTQLDDFVARENTSVAAKDMKTFSSNNNNNNNECSILDDSRGQQILNPLLLLL